MAYQAAKQIELLKEFTILRRILWLAEKGKVHLFPQTLSGRAIRRPPPIRRPSTYVQYYDLPSILLPILGIVGNHVGGPTNPSPLSVWRVFVWVVLIG